MRKKITFLLVLSFLFFFNSCTRDEQDAPDWIPNSGITFYLIGESNPTGIYVPYPSVRSTSVITVWLYNSLWEPQAGKYISFQQFELKDNGDIAPYGLGYFNSCCLSNYAVTGPDGAATILYTVPGFDMNSPVHGAALFITRVLISATLVEVPAVSTSIEVDVTVAPKPVVTP